MIWRLPIVRHVRWFYYAWRCAQHYRMWGEIGYLPVHAELDDRALDAIWRGER